MLHLVQVAAHGGLALEGWSQSQFETQTGQGRAQVVADRGEQGGALIDVALNPISHGHEGDGGGANLARAVRLEPGHGLATSEGFGRVGQTLDGADLITNEQDGDAHQQNGRHRQPQDEDMGLRRHRALAWGDDAQHPLRLLHLNVDIGGIAGGVEPVGAVQTRIQGLVQHPVHHADGAAAFFRRKGAPVLKHDGQGHGSFGAIGQLVQVRRAGVVLIAFDGPGDVAGQPFGQARGHRLPVGVEEDPGHRHLHHQHRQDDDQQRPAPERGRQAPLQKARPQIGGQKPHRLSREPAYSRRRAPSGDSAGSWDQLPACGADASPGRPRRGR